MKIENSTAYNLTKSSSQGLDYRNKTERADKKNTFKGQSIEDISPEFAA